MSSILLRNALRLATLDNHDRVLENVDLLIRDRTIAAVGTDGTSDRTSCAIDEIIDCTGKVVLPGFVNTHHHLYQTLTRALPRVQDAKLFDWLVDLYEVWREIDANGFGLSARVGLAELLLTGTTTTTDHLYVFRAGQPTDLIDREIAAARELGIRFHPTRGSMSRGRSLGGLPPDEVVQREEEILEDCERLIETFHDPAPLSMCRIALAPCSPFSVTTELLAKTAELARRRGVRLHTHLAETLDENDYCLTTHRLRPLAYMAEVDWLGDDVWYAHGIHFDDDEIDRLALTGTGIAHCPTSNLRLGSGIARVPALLAAGVPVGLAVDGSASNDCSSMLAELRQALLVHRVGTGVSAMTVPMVLRMATRGGARLLGRDDIGMLAPGKAADIAIFDLREIGYAGGLHDPLGALLFCGTGSRADTVIVDGRVRVRGGRLVDIDEQALAREAQEYAARVVGAAARRTGLDYHRRRRQT